MEEEKRYLIDEDIMKLPREEAERMEIPYELAVVNVPEAIGIFAGYVEGKWCYYAYENDLNGKTIKSYRFDTFKLAVFFAQVKIYNRKKDLEEIQEKVKIRKKRKK